ncbi:MAG TPA: hypothetical protein VFV66_07715 [Nonomuraea sp.]|nr:hypothetical protein [Nonomuraea sp.]
MRFPGLGTNAGAVTGDIASALDVRPCGGPRRLEDHGARHDLYRVYDNDVTSMLGMSQPRQPKACIP